MQGKIKKLVFEIQFDNESSPYNGKYFQQSYLKKFILFRQSIIQNLKDYIAVDVVPKQPPRFYSPLQVPGNNNLYHDLKHNKLVHFPRKGSFEVTIDNFLVFSRLQTGKWPNTETLTQWAFKVAEKMLDVQFEKERATIQNSKLQIYSKKEETSIWQKGPKDSQNRRSKSINKSFAQQKLPRIGKSIGQKSNLISNFTTLPVRPPNKNSNFTPQKHNWRQDLPNGLNKEDFQKTQRMFRYCNNKQQPKRQNIYFSDSKSGSKHQSFHWNNGSPINLSLDKSKAQRDTVYRNKKIELEPLQKQFSSELNKDFLNLKLNQQVEEKTQKIELKISQSHLNTFRGFYQVTGNFITKKIQGQKWTPILCQNVLPLKGQYYFNLAVIHSIQNMIKIGIVPLSYYPDALQKGERKDQFFIGYDCSNGMIRDSKLEEHSDVTSWRLGGQSAPLRKPYPIKVMIDMDANYIDWYIEQDIVASSKLTRSFSQGFRVILNIARVNDCILINQQNWKQRIKQRDGKNYFQGDKSKVQKEEQVKKKNQFIQEQKDIQKQRELTIDQGIQTFLVGTIKKQRVSKFLQRKRNVSAVRDQSALEQQLLVQQGSKILQNTIILNNENEQKKDLMESKPIIIQKQLEKDSNQTKKTYPQAETKIKVQVIEYQGITVQSQYIKPLLIQNAASIQNKQQQKLLEGSIVIHHQQIKDTSKLQKEQSKNLYSKPEEPQEPLPNNQLHKVKTKVAQDVPKSQQTSIKIERLKSQVKQQILNIKSDKKQEQVHEKDQKIEWIGYFQENTFKIKQKVTKE